MRCSFKIYGNLDKDDAKKFQKDLDKAKFEVQEDYTEYDEEDTDYVSVDILAYGTRNDIEEFVNKWELYYEDY